VDRECCGRDARNRVRYRVWAGADDRDGRANLYAGYLELERASEPAEVGANRSGQLDDLAEPACRRRYAGAGLKLKARRTDWGPLIGTVVAALAGAATGPLQFRNL
jgi:hypothetical protein